MVMSLWKVSDAATTDLMVAYYGRLLKGECWRARNGATYTTGPPFGPLDN